MTQYELLTELNKTDGKITTRELAKKIGFNASRVSNPMMKLRKYDLVNFERDPKTGSFIYWRKSKNGNAEL